MMHAISRLFLLVLCLQSLPSLSSNATEERSLRAGKRIFEQCANCHTLTPKAFARMGPHLHGIVGRKVGALSDYPYSEALANKTGVWSERELDRFLTRPSHNLKGTTMPFRGIMSPNARKDLIKYLKQVALHGDGSLSDDDILLKLQSGDPYRGAALAERCIACHNIEEGEGNSIGPNLHGIFGRKIAAAPDFIYSSGLSKRTGYWNEITLNSFMFESKNFGQGTHMAFKTLQSLQDRADVIAWLKTVK